MAWTRIENAKVRAVAAGLVTGDEGNVGVLLQMDAGLKSVRKSIAKNREALGLE